MYRGFVKGVRVCVDAMYVCVCVYMCVYVCVCVCERERERADLSAISSGVFGVRIEGAYVVCVRM